MKRKILLSLLGASLLLSTPALGMTEKSLSADEALDVATLRTLQVDVTPSFTLKNEAPIIGENTQLIIEKISGVQPTGSFEPINNEKMKLNADGTLTVLTNQEIEFTPIFKMDEGSISKIKLAYIAENNITNMNVADIEEITKDIAQVIKVQGKEQKPSNIQIDVTPHFTFDKTEMRVGETGQLNVSPINGVKVTGTFSGSNAFMTVAEDGTVTAIKANSEAQIAPHFTLSDESAQALVDDYNQKNGTSLSINDSVFIVKDIQQIIPVHIQPFLLGSYRRIMLPKTTIEVGESIQMNFEKEYGIQPTGTFTEYKDEFIEIKSDGTITGLKVGKSSVGMSGTFSNESLEQLKAAYIKENNLTNITTEDIDFVFPDNLQHVSIEVVDSTIGSTTSGAGKTYASTQKTLPQTDEVVNNYFVLIGLAIMATTGSLIFKMKNIK